MRKLCYVFSAVFLLLALFSGGVSAEETWTDSNGLVYSYDVVTDESGTYAVLQNIGGDVGEGTLLDLVLPNTINGKPLKVINRTFYSWAKCLNSVTIPANVTELGEGAFSGHDEMTAVTFASGSKLTKIGKDAFLECRSLKEIIIPDSVTEIGSRAFFRNFVLTKVTLGTGKSQLKTIGDSAFSGDEALVSFAAPGKTGIVLPNHVVSVGNNAFEDCFSVKSIVFDDALTAIGEYSFAGCEITELSLPDKVTDIPDYAFGMAMDSGHGYGAHLKSLKLGKYTKTIGNSAFYDTENLTELNLPDTLVSIGDDVFAGSNITKLVLPDSLESIGERTFGWCEKLTSITWPNNNAFTEIPFRAFASCTSLPDAAFASLPPWVTTIGEEAFSDCGFTKLAIPATITSIGAGAFAGGEKLKSLTFEDGSKALTIGENAFTACTGLSGTTIILPKRVDTLSRLAFAGVADGEYKYYTFRLNSPAPTYYIYNKNIKITDGYEMGTLWGDFAGTIYYPRDMTVQTSPSFFEMMRTHKEELENGVTEQEEVKFLPFDASKPPVIPHKITGTLPAGASVGIAADGKVLDAALSGQSFSAEAPGNVAVAVTVSAEGYADKTYTKAAKDFTADWNLGTISLSALTPLSNTGSLRVAVSGAGADGANVVVFNGKGALAASGRAENGSFEVAELPAGKYTVIAFGDNPYFSSLAAESDLAAMGIAQSAYAKAAVTVKAVDIAAASLSVPKADFSSLAGLVAKGDVLSPVTEAAVGSEISFRLNYRMAADHPASALTINVPKGLTVTSVVSARKDYGKTVNITSLDQNDKNSGVFFVTVKATEAGSYNLSAAVTSGGVKVPLGSAGFDAFALKLTVPARVITAKNFSATVIAAPETKVTLQVGDGKAVVWTTNKKGYATGLLNLPAATVTGVSADVTAKIGSGGNTVTAAEEVFYATAETELTEMYFIHAGTRYDSVKNGRKSLWNRYVYIANGEEKNKYWTFSATFRGRKLESDAILDLYMMDGSTRSETMSVVKEKSLANGDTEQTFACTFYLDQAGDHIFDPALVPVGYDVDYSFAPKAIPWGKEHIDYLIAKADDSAKKRQQIVSKDDEDIMPYIFGRNYIISVRTEYIWYRYLPAEDQQAIVNLENALQDLFKAASLNAVKGIDEYDGWQQYLSDNGVDCKTGQNFNAEQLKKDGYTVSDDGKTAFKPKTDGSGDQTGIIYRNSDGELVDLDYEPFDIPPAKEHAIEQAINNADNVLPGIDGVSDADISAAVNKAFPNAADRPAAEKQAKAAVAKLKKTGVQAIPAAREGFKAYQVWQQSGKKADMDKAIDELKKDVELIDEQIQEAAKNHVSNDCVKALQWERYCADALLTQMSYLRRSSKIKYGIDGVFTYGGKLAGPYDKLVAGAAFDVNLAIDIAMINNAGYVDDASARYLRASLDRMRKCRKTNGRSNHGVYLNVQLDPSGTVYEAVESNLLAGVTATIYDVGNKKNWDAAAYDQVNPQTTAADGAYAWDVPTGQWKVNFKKDGYDNAATDTLTVPPPRMGLKTAMVSKAAPKVTAVNAYPDYVEILFSQYMDTAVPTVSGYTCKWVDPEPVSEGSRTAYAKILRLTPKTAPKVGDTVSFTLKGLKNYAGRALGNYDSGKLTVKVRPAKLEMNYNGQIAVLVGEAPVPRVTVRVLDTENKPIAGLNVTAAGYSDLLAEVTAVNAKTDQSGTAAFSVNGLLPGMTELTLAVEGTSLETTLPLLISVNSNQVARPTAVIGETALSAGAPKDNYVTVPAGTKLSLACATEGATIFYTLDDTCPCQNTAARKTYTEPVTLTEDAYFRVSAYKEGMEYSERLNIHVTVTGGTSFRFDDVTDEKAFYYTPVYWAVNHDPQITNGTDRNHFSPVATCTRGQVVTFLWRAKGCPEPASAKNPFTDVKSGAYYYKAVLWAVENGITQGTSKTTFGPDQGCTRGQVATFLHRTEGTPKAGGKNPFTDVKSGTYYYDAVLWAVANNITNGTSATMFSPDATCTRGQIVTFLYRDLAK